VSDNFTLESQQGRKWIGKRLLLKALGWLSDGVIAQSVRATTFYEQFSRHVFFVPHAIDTTLFSSSAGGLTRSDGRTTFLFVGKLISRKRVADLVRAAVEVPGAEVWIVGSGPDEARLARLATDLRAPVTFLGFQDQPQLARLYQQADVLVLPSSIETFGLVVSEAASCGCVPIVSDSCGVVDSLVIHDETGLVFETGRVDQLAERMRAVSDRSFRDRLARNLEMHARDWTARRNSEAFVNSCLAIARATSEL
jgi:glycosyltransferase involved in cell wall biosynthesis